MVEIKWKPEELPINTVIEDNSVGDMIKSGDNCWEIIGSDRPYWSVKDEEIEEFEILAIPKSWYEEYRPATPNSRWLINREGHAKQRDQPEDRWTKNNIPPTQGENRVLLLEGELVPIEEAVRRAFNG